MRVFYELRGLHYIGEGNVARKSEFEKLIAELLNSAWWLSFIVAGGAYLFLGVFIPRQFSEHKVLFGKSTEGRFFRFAALSGFDGQIFASAAEIDLIIE